MGNDKSYSVEGSVIEFTLDKHIYKKEAFQICRVYSKSEQIKHMVNKIYGNISIKGKMPLIKSSIVYNATIISIEENKFGYTLNVDMVYPRDFSSDSINTDKDMINFIEVFIGEGTADKVRNINGICKIIQEKDKDKLVSIKGIGYKIADKLIQTYDDDAVGSKFLIKLKKLGFSDNEVNKLSELHGKNLITSYDLIKEDIFKLVFSNNFRLDRMDEIYLNGLGGNKTDMKRINAYIWKGLKDFMYDGYKSYATLEEFYNLEVIDNVRYNIGDELLDKCIKNSISDKRLNIIDDKIITTYSEYQIEMNLIKLLNEISNNKSYKLEIDDIDKELNIQEDIIGFKLNKGQRYAVKDILLSDKSICMLNGLAGTGKSSVTKVILNIYEKYNKGDFRLCALSGRASSILGESSGYKECSSTIHRLLGRDEYGQWLFNYDNKFTNTDILCMDEISMVDYYMLYSALAPCNEGLKVILLGDDGQLPSLSFGSTIETMKMFDIQVNELTQVMRQSEDAYILKIASDVRGGVNPFENIKYRWYGDDVEVCIGDSYRYMLDSFIEDYKKDKNSSIIATTTKSKSDNINFDIQDILISEGLINTKEDCITKPSNIKGKMFKMYVGNHIMVLKNNYNCINCDGVKKEDLFKTNPFNENEDSIVDIKEMLKEEDEIFNGEIYLIECIVGKYVLLTDGNKSLLVESKNLDCTLAYSCNVHKLQGSGFKNVYVYHTSDYVDTNIMVSKQWMYTAYTRAKVKLSIHTDVYRNLTKGINRDAIDEKCTIVEYVMGEDR
ncbi:MAG: AAA family ATPase [Bacilli bacterium]